jgi:hypothetical protein
MPRFKSKKPQTFGVDSNSVSYRDGIVRLCPTVFPGAVVVDAKTVRGSIKIKYKNKKRVIKEMRKASSWAMQRSSRMSWVAGSSSNPS